MEAKDIKASDEYLKLLGRRSQFFFETSNIVAQLKLLGSSPLPHRFEQLENNFEELVEKWDTENNKMIACFTKKNIDPMVDDLFQDDQNNFNKELSNFRLAFDELRLKLETEGKLKTIVEYDSPDGLSTIVSSLNVLTNSQADLAKAITVKPKYPTVQQPFFTPSNDASDYLKFKDFLTQFQAYIMNVKNDHERLYFLRTSLKGEAFSLIQSLTLEDANYKVALDLLKKNYYDCTKLRYDILDFFACQEVIVNDDDFKKIVKIFE